MVIGVYVLKNILQGCLGAAFVYSFVDHMLQGRIWFLLLFLFLLFVKKKKIFCPNLESLFTILFNVLASGIQKNIGLKHRTVLSIMLIV